LSVKPDPGYPDFELSRLNKLVVESRNERVTFREEFTGYLKVNELAYPLYFSTSLLHVFAVSPAAIARERPDLV